MIQRMIGAAFFNAHTYEEVEADQGALGQAIGVVILVTICGAIGGLIGDIIEGATFLGVVLGLCLGLTFGIVRWALWVTVILMVGGGLLRSSGTKTSWAEMGASIGLCLYARCAGHLFLGARYRRSNCLRRLCLDPGRRNYGRPPGYGL